MRADGHILSCLRGSMSRWAYFEQDGGCCGDFSCLVGSNLVLQIISGLQLRDLIKVRLVCKSWYDAVLSPQFLNIWKDKEERIWAVLGVRTQESQEEYGEHLWYPVSSSLENHREIWYVSISSSPLEIETQSVRSLCMLPMPFLPNGTKFEGLLSSHGLVLARLMDYDEDSKHNIKLVVGNPITNTWKPLPLAPLPPKIPPYAHHQFSMERDPNSGDYIIVVFLFPAFTREEGETTEECLHRLLQDPEADEEEWFFHVLQYESKLGTWCQGPTLIECTTSHHDTLLQGSMVTVELFGLQDTQMYSVYDPLAMAWSHLHIAFSFDLVLDDEDWGGCRCGKIAGFKYGDKYFLATCFFSLELREDLGVGIWELDEQNKSWKLVARRRYKDLYGAGWWSDVMDMNWKCQLVGEHVFFSSTYKPSTHGVTPPIAFNMHHFTWICALTEEEKCGNANFSRVIDYECAYAFIPSLAARV